MNGAQVWSPAFRRPGRSPAPKFWNAQHALDRVRPLPAEAGTPYPEGVRFRQPAIRVRLKVGEGKAETGSRVCDPQQAGALDQCREVRCPRAGGRAAGQRPALRKSAR
jgi:hypothetical protein